MYLSRPTPFILKSVMMPLLISAVRTWFVKELPLLILPPGSENADNVQWSFSGPANVTINEDNSANVFWGSFGIFSATLSVTDNGCTATRVMTISVINNPATCGNGFTATGSVNNLLGREINVNWTLPMDGSAQTIYRRAFSGRWYYFRRNRNDDSTDPIG